ncbi:MAG: hypothetical protein K2N48_01710, partial [Muribaculaceae bacterium]|nr:hypothetical protein [Muribaculaceae bacterium]
MAKVWDKDIDKNTDWGGDESTGNLPVSGEKVQKFIKDQLNSKAGCFWYDTTKNRYLVFSDTESRDAYIENPQDNEGLVLGTFDAPINYSVEIYLTTDQFVPVLKGTTGNYIEFTFDTKNLSGQSVREDITCTYTFVRGSIRKVVTQKYRAGSSVKFNVDDYIETGTNSITLSITGQTTLASTTLGITYQVVDLSITDEFNVSKVHDLSQTSQIEVPYTISGYGTKVVEWYLDGVLLDFVKNEDEVTENATSRVKYISISGFSQGTHHLQFRAYTIINGEKYYSNILYREFIVYNRDNNDPILAIATDLPLGAQVLGPEDSISLHGISQYLPYSLRIGLFNPSYSVSTPLEVYLDDSLVTTLTMKNDVEVVYDLVVMSYGEQTLKFKVDLKSREIPVFIDRSSASVEEITQGLSLALSATGKSNSAIDRNVWKFGKYSTTFNWFKWLDNSGWCNGELIISDGASISVNCAPLAEDVLNTGKTLEFEFSTRNVYDIDAVICDLRNEIGVGLLITASEASLVSSGGSKVSTRYKPDENIRLSFVINRRSGVTDKGLVFMYVNGILSGAANYAVNDNFMTSKMVTIASSSDVEIALRHIRFYDSALTANQILNNYILYRESSEKFLKVYNRNNIYEEGSTEFSTDILSGQLPVMIITGNIPALEATTDKKLQIEVDVEYINLQDPTRSFKIEDGVMTPQGTSSMSYPKKNFRLYTQKKDSTILYDADGKVVGDKLYAFKKGSQPVNCWCFKADVAESSGTHNTGVARLWNDVLKNAQINGEYKLRTKAQQIAIDNGYPYDVRTAIDGFPVVLFYRLTENDPLVFIGKYNFNNDKSTESVFGFRDIPGFDNRKVQCWEVLSNGNHLALFEDTTNWNSEWSDAFEARYPDGSSDTKDLKSFATWMTTVSETDFIAQKWDHLDVYKMAAYYIYLIRFGAVDQVVKNSMFTTEDGVHWFYINYDNDTVGGLRNDGPLVYLPTIDRQTRDTSFSTVVYAYAGHDSRLWNLLEADTEFMQIVSEVDSALYAAGLTYENLIRIFDTEQSDKWCERIYNQDAQYKYIGPFNEKGINNLFMLQGSRQSHRRWWFSERFSLIDAKFISGEYKANTFEVKLAGAPVGLDFSIKAGVSTYYGYGVNNVPIQYGVNLEKGDTHVFTTTSVLNVGDPLRLYAGPYLEEIDISNFAPYLAQISISHVYSERLGTNLKSLIIGSDNEDNTALTELSGINQAYSLKNLNVTRLKGLKSLDLTNNTQLESLIANDSGLTSVILPSGAPVTSLKLPASLQALTLDGLFSLEHSGLQIQNNGCNLTTIEITNCPSFDSLEFVENWMDYKNAENSMCSLIINGVEWEGVDPDWLINLGNLRVLSLKGTISVTEVTEEQLTELQQIFGRNCFSRYSELYIKVPATSALFLVGPDNVRALSSAQFEVISTVGEGTSSIEIEYPSSMWDSEKAKITLKEGYLTVGDIDGNYTITILGKFLEESGVLRTKRKSVTLQKVIYPSSATITGVTEITKKGVFQYQLSLGEHDEDAQFIVTWSLSGDAVTNNYVELGTTNESEANIISSAIEDSSFILKAELHRGSDNKLLCSKTLDIITVPGEIIMTSSSNYVMMNACYRAGYTANSRYMTSAEASMVTSISDTFSDYITSKTTFNEFVYFVNVSSNIGIPSNVTEITLPFENIDERCTISSKIIHCPYLKTISVFATMNKATVVDMPNLTTLSRALYVDAVEELNLPNLTTIDTTGMLQIRSLENLTLPKLKTASSTMGSGYG